jgi:hypothetical protein
VIPSNHISYLLLIAFDKSQQQAQQQSGHSPQTLVHVLAQLQQQQVQKGGLDFRV